MGTYNTLEQAVFVKTLGRELLRATDGLELTDEEIEENRKLIKTKAAGALSEFLEKARAETPKAPVEMKEEECPFRTFGVRELHSGRWVSLFTFPSLRKIWVITNRNARR